ncbi:MAG: D-alanine--D-alanine ligase [Candidatus Methylacidiphilales bacterium]
MNHNEVIVLKGGFSSEREVSLRTGAAVASALRSEGMTVTELDITAPDFVLPESDAPVFICLHGIYGEDGTLQKRLELEGRLFTGSGSEACRRAFNKLEARDAFASSGLPVPHGGRWIDGIQAPLPLVLKPCCDGSSVGVYIVKDEASKVEAEQAARQHGDYLFEEFVEGRELTVGVLNGCALPIVEVTPHKGFYDYQNKYTAGKTKHQCPALLDDEITRSVQDLALRAHACLGCEVYSRVDIIFSVEKGPVILELNAIPGMTELSLLPEAAAAAGITFNQLCLEILRASQEVRR